MKAARIALRSAAPLAGASAGSGRLPQEVEQFSRFSPSPLSIKQLLDFGESRGERGEVGAGVQRGSFPRGRGAGAALCGTEEAAIPARSGPRSASAEVAAASPLGRSEESSGPAGYSHPR